MKKALVAIVVCASLLYSHHTLAQGSGEPDMFVTAVCRSPTGTTLIGGAKPQSETDGFGGGLFTYSWKVGSATATIVSQSGTAAGSTPSTEQATVVQSKGFVTFFVLYERAMWAHSLFIESGTVMISRHVTGTSTSGPKGGIYTASCSIAAK